jgi:hypothetical protein
VPIANLRPPNSRILQHVEPPRALARLAERVAADVGFTRRSSMADQLTKVAEHGGGTLYATNYQTVIDTRRRQLWIKIPSPDHFADWTHFDLPELWS